MLSIFLTESLLTQFQGAPEDGDVPVLPERPSEPPCAVRCFADGIIACFLTDKLKLLNGCNFVQFYMKTGNCKFGITCKFHHPKDVQIQPIEEENVNGLQNRILGDATMQTPFVPALMHNSKGLPVRPVCLLKDIIYIHTYKI